MALGDMPLRSVSIHDAARYFQGDGSYHNHPMIYCTGSHISVCTKFGEVNFKCDQLLEAVIVFQKHLKEMKYYDYDRERNENHSF